MKYKKLLRHGMAAALLGFALVAGIVVSPVGTETVKAYSSYGDTLEEGEVRYGDLIYKVVDGSITITGCKQSAITVTIPGIIDEKTVTSIGTGAFSGCNNLTSVSIPASVTSIEYQAFFSCNSLTSVNIPASVTSIGEQVFTYSSNLTEINVDGKNPKYSSEDGVLYDKNKTELIVCPGGKTSVSIPSGVKRIGDKAFFWCRSLTNVTIPSGVTSIGATAFCWCNSLKNVTIPSGVTSIGGSAFYGTGLTSVTIPSGVKSIGEDTFRACNSLTRVTISSGVTSIGAMAFYDCHSLSSVTVPSSVTSIGNSSFGDCRNLIEVYYGGSEKQWNKIKIGESNEYLTLATIHFDCDTIRVQKVAITINGQPASGTLKAKVNKTYTFKAVITPSNVSAANKKITWSSSNKNVATVKNGKVTIKKAGTVTITAKTADGKSAKVKLNASNKAVKVSKVKISSPKGKKTMKVKEKLTLTFTVNPATADNTKVTWSSSNKKIATVDKNGKVTAKKKGTVTITAKAKDGSGKKATIKIKVTK